MSGFRPTCRKSSSTFVSSSSRLQGALLRSWVSLLAAGSKPWVGVSMPKGFPDSHFTPLKASCIQEWLTFETPTHALGMMHCIALKWLQQSNPLNAFQALSSVRSVGASPCLKGVLSLCPEGQHEAIPQAVWHISSHLSL